MYKNSFSKVLVVSQLNNNCLLVFDYFQWNDSLNSLVFLV